MTEEQFIKSIAPLARVSYLIEIEIRKEMDAQTERLRGQLYLLKDIAGQDSVPTDYFDEEYVMANMSPSNVRDEIVRILRELRELRDFDLECWDACRSLRRYDFKGVA